VEKSLNPNTEKRKRKEERRKEGKKERRKEGKKERENREKREKREEKKGSWNLIYNKDWIILNYIELGLKLDEKLRVVVVWCWSM